MRTRFVAIGIENRHWGFTSVDIAWAMVQGPDVHENSRALRDEVAVNRVICFTLATVGS